MDNPTTQLMDWHDGDAALKVEINCLGVDITCALTPPDGEKCEIRIEEMRLDEAEDFAAKLLSAVRAERATLQREGEDPKP